MDLGSDVSCKNLREQNALHIATKLGNETVASLLISAMSISQLDSKDEIGRNALLLACKRGSFAIAKALSDAGADIDATDETNTAALEICDASIFAKVWLVRRERHHTSDYVPNYDILTSSFALHRRATFLDPGYVYQPADPDSERRCEVARTIAVAKLLEGGTHGTLVNCLCSNHIRGLTTKLLGDVKSVEDSLCSCPCPVCQGARWRCDGPGVSEVLHEPSPICVCSVCEQDDGCKDHLPDSHPLGTYKGHEYYDEQITTATPNPCECFYCGKIRSGGAELFLSKLGFRSEKIHTFDPNQIWSSVIQQYLKCYDQHGVLQDIFREVVLHLMRLVRGPTIDLSYNGSTLLHEATRVGHLDMAAILIEHGANVNLERNLDSLTPLRLALLNDRATMMRMLLKNGAQVDKMIGRSLKKLAAEKESVLNVCISNYGKHGHLLPVLLAHKPRVDNEDSFGFTPLQEAITHRRPPAILALVQAGANTELATRSAPEPLHHAVELGYPEVVHLLIETGAKTRVLGKVPTAMHFAAKIGAFDAILSLLNFPQCVDDLHVPDHKGRTPLHRIAEHAYTDGASMETISLVVSAMVEVGANASCEDSTGSTPLHKAVQVGNLAMTRLLLQVGAN